MLSPYSAQLPAIPEGSPMLRTLFVVLAAAVAVMFVIGVGWSVRRAGEGNGRREAMLAAFATAGWFAITGMLASAGALTFTAPPTMMLLIAVTLAMTVVTAFSPLGRRMALELPVAALVGFQAFRVAVELLLHRAYTEGLMPEQMSYSGLNFDIVSGLSAIIAGVWFARRRPSPALLFAWNTLGFALLLNILTVALLSAPTPMRVFMNEPSNIWITRAPWVWLPTVMVVAALLGHLLVYRRLWIESRVTVKSSRAIGAVVALAALLMVGCDEPTGTAQLPEKPVTGAMFGVVTLLGNDGPAEPGGKTITLYRTLDDLDTRNPAYTATLTPRPGAPRSFDYLFPAVKPGQYYMRACFSIGCAEYRIPETGAPRSVAVPAGKVTRVSFGV